MTDCRFINALPINRKSLSLLKENKVPMDRRRQIAAAQLMLWFLAENPNLQLEAWAQPPWAERDQDAEQAKLLLLRLEKNDPQLLMRLLTRTESGDAYQIDLSGTAQEAAETMLEELMSAIQAQPKLLNKAA